MAETTQGAATKQGINFERLGRIFYGLLGAGMMLVGVTIAVALQYPTNDHPSVLERIFSVLFTTAWIVGGVAIIRESVIAPGRGEGGER